MLFIVLLSICLYIIFFPLDFETAYRLELVEPLEQMNTKASLFGVVNHCVTKSGTRRLRANILQPFNNKISITTRHNGISELISKPYMMGNIQVRCCLKYSWFHYIFMYMFQSVISINFNLLLYYIPIWKPY